MRPFLGMIFLSLTLLTVPSYAQSVDDRIIHDVQQSYIFRSYLNDDTIHIQSSQAHVTLTGTVSSLEHKRLAEDTVRNISGVKDVSNQLQVQGPNPIEYSDAWMTLKVKSALLFHRSVSSIATHVTVKDRIVTLTGDANSESQKELTTEYARDVEGVKDVINNMNVVPGSNATNLKETFNQTIDDASITAQVKAALLMHHSTSAISTHVSTQNGVVTLSGKAKNQAEIDLVNKLVGDIDGVKSIVNHMSLQ